jgi:hypothetical protein
LKIRLDECISHRVANAVTAVTANRKGFEVSHVRHEHGPGTSDPDWIAKFAAVDGTAIVSGDYNILKNWPDLIAYKESRLVGFFPPPAFRELSGYGRAALILRWWPTVIEKIKTSVPGDTWRWPMLWTPDITKFEELKDPRFGKDGKVLPITKAKVHRHRP